ncbi:MAG: hypothetical protein HQL30_08680 [Candidatus Omnitrophica bacterium]|nr:hypothetical protein [Candidatus Omnitrophota bacterium]
MNRRGTDSEYKRLKAVLLHKGGPEIERVLSPGEVLYSGKISYPALAEEFGSLEKVFTSLGVKVFHIDASRIDGTDPRSFYNLMYARDLFWASSGECLISRMRHEVRRDEVKYAARTLSALGMSIRETYPDGAHFEGADILWLSPREVMVGVGGRTNDLGFEAITRSLSAKGIGTIRVPAPGASLHLLGSVQIASGDLVFVRRGIGSGIMEALERNGMRVVTVPETDEVSKRFAMSVVTVAPREVIMPRGNPGMKDVFLSSGVTVVREIETRELIKGGGGLGCAVGILERVV